MRSIKFGVITDLHHCDADIYLNRYFRKTLGKIDETVQVFGKYQPDFIVNLGDTIDRGFENFDPVLNKLKLLKAPVYNILGNHDYDVADQQKMLIVKKLNMPDNYYKIEVNGFQLIFLDGNEISTYANQIRTANHALAKLEIEKLNKSDSINGNDYNGGISEKQLSWLQNQLTSGDENNLKSILFCHFPIFPRTKYNLLNDMEVISIISQYKNVILWVCGHDHDGNYGKVNNCHVINLKGLVETEHENAFSIFEVNNNHININGFGREVDRLLKI